MGNHVKTNLPQASSILLILASIGLFFTAVGSPLLGTLTAESALLFTAILAPLTFIAGATRGATRSTKGFSSDFLSEGGFVLIASLFFIVAGWFNSWRFESCATDTGLTPFVILAAPVLCLNLCTGIWLGRLIGHVKLTVFVAILAIVVYIAAQISTWWMSPTLRFFNHHWLMIAGDLLQGQGLTAAIVGFRLATFLFALSLYLFGVAIFRNIEQRRAITATMPLTGFIIAATLLLLSAFMIHSKTSQQIQPSRSQMLHEYNAVKHRGQLVIHANPIAMSPDQIEAILAEGTLWLKRVEERSGIKSQGNIHIWLHSDANKQAYYTGAKHVHFAIPSHREIHISDVKIPHPTLGHEIAHILIGQESNTLFGSPGVLGIIPNIGLSEGLAVMLTPELAVKDDLTIEEQTAALYRLGHEKDFDSLFSVDLWNFWSRQNTSAYVCAGTYLSALLDSKSSNLTQRHGLIQKLANSGELYTIWENSKEQDSFNKQFLTMLTQLELPADAMPSTAHSTKGGFATERCNSKQAALEKHIDEAASQRFYEKAQSLVAKLPENQADAYVHIAQTAHRLGDIAESLSFLELAKPKRDQWTELIGNYAFQIAPQKAQLAYRSIDITHLSPPAQRQLSAKIAFMQSILLGSNTAVAQAGMSLLTLDSFDTAEVAARYAALVGALSTNSEPIAEYLIARGQIMGGNYNAGLKTLIPLMQSGSLPSEFSFETPKLVARAYAMTKKTPQFIETLDFMRPLSHRASHKLYIADFSERAQLAEKNKHRDKWLLGIP